MDNNPVLGSPVPGSTRPGTPARGNTAPDRPTVKTSTDLDSQVLAGTGLGTQARASTAQGSPGRARMARARGRRVPDRDRAGRVAASRRAGLSSQPPHQAVPAPAASASRRMAASIRVPVRPDRGSGPAAP